MRVFLSYHIPDHLQADALRAAIEKTMSGADVFFAPYNLKLGAFWLPQLGEAIAASDAFLLFIGRHLGEWQKLEYYEAVNRHLNTKKTNDILYPVVPVITSEQPPNLPFIGQLHWIESSEPNAPDTLSRIVDALHGEDIDAAPQPWLTINPYRGLLALEEQDADFFFGREKETAEIVRAAMERSDQLITLIGNSGVGKSSLMQAGVVSTLKRRRLPGGIAWPDEWVDSRQWAYLTMKPGENPIRSLAAAFTKQWFEDPTDPIRLERTDGWENRLNIRGTLSELVDATESRFHQLGMTAPKRTLLYIDQGEELYSRGTRTSIARFSEILIEGLRDDRVTIMTSQRADYYGQIHENEMLWPATHIIDVPPLRADALKDVLRRPAEVLGARFENSNLVDMIVAAAEGQAGALPLLADFMTELWERMQASGEGDGVLRLSERPEILDVGASLARRADKFLNDYSAQHDVARRLFALRLTHVPRQGDPVRRRARLDMCSHKERELIELLAGPAWRLLVTGEEDGTAIAEVAHEVLLRRWGTLRDWLEAERAFLIWRDETEVRRKEWEAEESSKAWWQRSLWARPTSSPVALLQGLQLEQALEWVATRPDDIEQDTRRYIQASSSWRKNVGSRKGVLLSLVFVLEVVVVILLLREFGVLESWK